MTEYCTFPYTISRRPRLLRPHGNAAPLHARHRLVFLPALHLGHIEFTNGNTPYVVLLQNRYDVELRDIWNEITINALGKLR